MCSGGAARMHARAGDRMELFGGATLLRLGGHFPGSACLHWRPGCGGRGILCTGAPHALRPGRAL